MANLKHQELEFGLEFKCNGFTERYVYSEGSSEPRRRPIKLVIQVQKVAFETVLLFFSNYCTPRVSINNAFNILKSDRSQWPGGQLHNF